MGTSYPTISLTIFTYSDISEIPLYIDETPAISIAAVSNRARRIKRLFGLDMVVIDYIQLIAVLTKNVLELNVIVNQQQERITKLEQRL